MDEPAANPKESMPLPRVAWVASAGTLQMLGQVLRPQAIALIDEMVELTAICPLGAETTELPTPPLEIIHYQPSPLRRRH